MFDQILIRRLDDGRECLDLGRVCEALLFYSKVHLVIDRPALSYLVKSNQLESFLQLIDAGFASASITPEASGVASQEWDALVQCGYETFSVTHTPEDGRMNRREQVSHILRRLIDDRWEASRISKKLLRSAKLIRISDKIDMTDNFRESVRRDIEDVAFRRFLLRSFLAAKRYEVGLGFDFDFRIVSEIPQLSEVTPGSRTGFLFRISANDETKRAIKELGRTPATLLAGVLSSAYEGRAESLLASSYGAELATTPTLSEVIALQFKRALQAAFPAMAQIDNFYSTIAPEMRSVREVINSGERSLTEFIKLLEKSSKFKEMIAGKHPDSTLLQTYVERIGAESYFDHLPIKTLRLLVFGMLGLASDAFVPGSSIAVSAVDSLIVERIVKGWRPNQFVDTKLKPFLEP